MTVVFAAASSNTPFSGPTRAPAAGANSLSFAADGALWMLGEGGLRVHRRGERDAVDVSGPDSGSASGVDATGRDTVIAATQRGADVFGANGTKRASFESGPASRVAVSADGARVAIGFEDRIEVWTIDSQKLLRRLDRDVLGVPASTVCFTFAEDSGSLWLFAGGRLGLAEVATTRCAWFPYVDEEDQSDALRIDRLDGGVWVSFAGRGAICERAGMSVSREGTLRFAADGEADATTCNEETGRIVVVRGTAVVVLARDGREVARVGRKATFVIDSAALSRDGWLALTSSGKSGARSKTIELLRI